jgi:hypothetical protein
MRKYLNLIIIGILIIVVFILYLLPVKKVFGQEKPTVIFATE